MYLRWRRLLPSWIVLRILELPGRGSRVTELPKKNYAALTSSLCDEVISNLPENYAFFGHSMGGLLAYGIAHGLFARNLPLPVALLISGCAAPNRQDSERYSKIQGEQALIADLRKQAGTPEEVFNHPELMAMVLNILAIDYSVCGSFRYTKLPALPLSINVFGGRSDQIDEPKLSDWRLTATRIFTLDWFDGGHFYFRQCEEVFLTTLVKRLAENVLDKPYEAHSTA